MKGEEKICHIKEVLDDNKLSIAWLTDRLNRYGIKAECREVSAILNGETNGPKARHLLTVSESIVTFYDETMNVKLK